MEAASFSSMLDQYRETFFQDALFAPDDVAALGASLHRNSRMKVIAGSGYMEQSLFKNGLMVGRGDYRLDRAHDGTFLGMETYFGVSLMVAGTYELTIPDLRLREPILVDQAWIRAGQVEAVHYTQPADQFLRGISIDVTAELLESWQDEAPKALNSGVRAALQHSGPVLRPLSGVGRELRGFALRILDLDSASLCGRLELESLALDFLVRVLRAGESGEAGLTHAERRERRLRIALEEARDILDAEWAAPPTIAELGRRVGLNECYLKAGFREHFGGTIAAYARQRRLERARDLIEREGHGVQEAALAVGFSNLGWFSSTFRTHFGCLPSHLACGSGR